MLSQADIDMARGLYNHGVSLYNLDKFYEAIVSIDKSLEIFSDFPDSWLVKGLCLSDLAGNLMGVISTEEDLKLMEYKHEADRCFDKALDLVDKIRDIPQAAKLEARILFNKGYNLNSINL